MRLERVPGVHWKSDLLGLPGFFYCIKGHCALRAEICVKRQRFNEICQRRNDSVPFLICEDCVQGSGIKKRME